MRTLVLIGVLVVAGAVLFAVNTSGPREWDGFPSLLVPLLGATIATRSLNSGLAAAALALGLGYVLALAGAVLGLL